MDHVSHDPDETHEALEGVNLQQLATGERMSVQYWEIEAGHVVPKHEHEHEQAGYIIKGTAAFLIGEDGEEYVFTPGDSYDIPSYTPHEVENRGDDTIVGLDIFSPPRGDPDWEQE